MIEHLLWSDASEAKLMAHGISRGEVVEMITDLNYIIFESPYTNQVRVTGYTRRYRWLTLAMEELSHNTFRPITGWPATETERQRFSRAEQGVE
ncbi:MAG TPA: hypothetical protein VGW38_29595 [Chloroflexota bacterium]|nr:hypothetical protein [Chloroflexota bacterium]